METEDDKRGLFNGIMSMPYQPKNYNTINEPIQMTGMDLDKIPPDTPNYLTDLTYHKIMNNLHAGMSVRITLTSMGCSRSKVGAVMKWILKDEKRKQEYLEAKLVGSEIMAEEMIDIADGTMDEGTVPEDTKRAKLRIDTRASIIAFNNKSRFGKETTINVNVDLKQALEEASMRAEVIEGEVVDE